MPLFLIGLWWGLVLGGVGATTPVLQRDGTLTVRLVSATQSPLAHTLVSFWLEDATTPSGSCTTDTSGTCTLVLGMLPTDASGLIRGSVRVGDARRPVIWPGGGLDLELHMTAAGHLETAADFIGGAEARPTGVPDTDDARPPAIPLLATPTSNTLQVTLTTTTTPFTATEVVETMLSPTPPQTDTVGSLSLWLFLAIVGVVLVWAVRRFLQGRRHG